MNLIKTTIATAAVITCCLGNEMPAQASTQNKAIAISAGITCSYMKGELNFEQAKNAMRIAYQIAGVPISYINTKATTDGAAQFIKTNTCAVFN